MPTFNKAVSQVLNVAPQSLRDCVQRIPQDTEANDFARVVAFLRQRFEMREAEQDDYLNPVKDLLRGRKEEILAVHQRISNTVFQAHWQAAIQANTPTTPESIEKYIAKEKGEISEITAQLLRDKAIFDPLWEAARNQQNDNIGQAIQGYNNPPLALDRYNHYINQLRPEVCERVQTSIAKVFQHLPDPAGSQPYMGRYLCVGQVQSGKTSHYSGIIAAAAGQGYKLIIVLAGRTRSLRNQTQHRLSKEHLHPGQNWENPLRYWKPMTQETLRAEGTDAGEFNGQPGDANPFRQLAAHNETGLLVVKKNYAVLERIKKALNDLTPEQRQQMPTLIIDDEADEASLNGYRLPVLGGDPDFQERLKSLVAAINAINPLLANQHDGENDEEFLYRLVTEVAEQAMQVGEQNNDDAEGAIRVRTLIESWYLGAKYLTDEVYDNEPEHVAELQNIIREIETGSILFLRTGINQRIIQIGGLLPKHCYLGYTATPSANILVNCEQETDLFPRHKIHLLTPSPDYRGLDYFYPPINRLEANEVPDRKFLIPKVEEDERTTLLAQECHGVPPDGLQRSVAYFFIASAIFKIRNNNQPKDTTMLVHVASTQDLHAYARPLVISAVNRFLDNAQRANLLAAIWDDIVNCAPAQALRLGKTPPQLDREQVEEVAVQLAQDVIDRQNDLVTIENSTQNVEDRVSYPEESGNPQGAGCHIVVGGNILARGLTLKRLLTSYFIRRPGNQASLLQMARWFGYWSGYEDLVRIWTTDDINDEFGAIAIKERDLAEQIANMGPELGAPENQALLIAYRRGIKPTSPHLMQYAQQHQNEGLHIGDCTVSTKAFYHRNDEILNTNITAAQNLISNAVQNDPARIQADGDRPRRIIRNVAGQLIIEFLTQYNFITQEAAVAFHGQAQQIPTWNLGIVGAAGLVFEWHPMINLGKTGRLRLRTDQPLGINSIASITDLPRTDDPFFDLRGVVNEAEYTSLKGLTARREAAKLRRRYQMPPFITLYALNENHALAHNHNSPGYQDWDGTAPCIGFVMSFPSNIGITSGVVWANRTVLD